MKILFFVPAFILSGLLTLAPAFGQVKMSEYQPLNFNEMLLNPRIKSRKYDENLNKLKALESKIMSYVEVNEFDKLFEVELTNFAFSATKVAEGDLSTKDADIQKLEFQFDKIRRDFEAREREGVTKLKLSHGSPIYNLPGSPYENSSSRLLGNSSDENTFIVAKHNDEYLKVKFKSFNGYVHKKFLR